MRTLTYKQELQLLRIANNFQVSASSAGEDSAFITLMRICRDYVNDSYPFVRGADRDAWLIERLKRYKIKFFDKI